jgi:enterobactin synthetase component D / holo-[acyl-carrier protein] synthase
MTVVQSPAILPSFAATVTVLLATDAHIKLIALPPELRGAAPKRRRQFMAGRYCAVQAAERLKPSGELPHVGRGPAGEPLWPGGLTGSITHTDDLASAAVARLSDARSLGIDSETIVVRARAQAIRSMVMLPAEAGLGGGALDDATRLTLVFSAKEAIFKCLYPVIGRRFYYEDVALTSADLADGSFAAEIVTTLAAGFERGTSVRGRFEIDELRVHTGAWLEPHIGAWQ